MKRLLSAMVIASSAKAWMLPVGVKRIGMAMRSNSRSLDFPKLSKILAPTNDLFRMFDDIDRFSPLGVATAMHMDVKEGKDHLKVIVDIPGVEGKDIHISCRDKELTISADKESTKKEEGENFHLLERRTGHISRTVLLPDHVDTKNIKANCKHGVLVLTIPKLDHHQEPEHKIEIQQE